jgi:hypothetical protein
MMQSKGESRLRYDHLEVGAREDKQLRVLLLVPTIVFFARARGNAITSWALPGLCVRLNPYAGEGSGTVCC